MNKIIKWCENPQFVIVTPLRPKDKISKETYSTVMGTTHVPFLWISSKGKGNVVQNFKKGINYLKKINEFFDYIIKIDNDTEWSYNTLDNMYYTLKNSNEEIAYSYCSFAYYGAINVTFPSIPFNSEKLRLSNYISSNSMFKTKVLDELPMIDDNSYKRLLDWVYYLHLLNNGYYGIPCEGFFKAKTNINSISAGSPEDYRKKYRRVVKDFIGA